MNVADMSIMSIMRKPCITYLRRNAHSAIINGSTHIDMSTLNRLA